MIIVDTSVWVSFFISNDSNNHRAKKIILNKKSDELIITDYIYTESLNVLRAKFTEESYKNFAEFLNELEISLSFTDHVLVRLATEYFFQFKKLSFTDCLVLASAKINDYEVATFDKDLQKAARIVLAL